MISLTDAPIALVGLQFLNWEQETGKANWHILTHKVIQSDYRKTPRLKRQSLT